ncbi:MAG: glycosyltransferase [Cytophagales bacterium]|jgi:glycosyltransferase involved in cell wall biosynthesis|tara:strand:- start:1264 stop:1431 length:168 start_codon:yes stop_codon:yes gene_type:complete
MLQFVKKQGIEDVSVFYNAIDIFALASHSETFGMVTIEAMLSKLPIIPTKFRRNE